MILQWTTFVRTRYLRGSLRFATENGGTVRVSVPWIAPAAAPGQVKRSLYQAAVYAVPSPARPGEPKVLDSDRSTDAFAKKYHFHSTQQDYYVPKHGRVLDVVEVVLELAFRIVNARAIGVHELCPPR